MNTIYFLCTGNSCRSQIAEGYGKKYLDGWTVLSAGIEAHGLNPKAVEVMKLDGVDISEQTSDVIHPDILNSADYVITLCGDAKDNCPVVPSHVKSMHWGFDDPAKATGSDEDIMGEFMRVRDDIKDRIIKFKEELS